MWLRRLRDLLQVRETTLEIAADHLIHIGEHAHHLGREGIRFRFRAEKGKTSFLDRFILRHKTKNILLSKLLA